MRTSASTAAALSEDFFEEPEPRPMRRPSTITTEVKVGSWASPSSETSLYSGPQRRSRWVTSWRRYLVLMGFLESAGETSGPRVRMTNSCAAV